MPAIGAYDALLADIRRSIAQDDPALAKALRLADQQHGSVARQHQPALGASLQALQQAGERLKATGAALQKAMAPLLPTRAEQIERARLARETTMAKAMNEFTAGRLSGHDVAQLEIASSDYLERFVASLPR